MKKISFFIFLIYSSISIAGEGIVLVLQAPLLKEPNFNSTVLQYIRKGEKIYIPNPVFSEQNIPEFISTYDRAGNLAYVPSKYLKLISNDESEGITNIKYGEHDPTDYRIEEPISKKYPFNDQPLVKASVSFSVGNNIKSPYNYQKQFAGQDYTMETGGRFLVSHKITFDSYDRFYFGLLVDISSVHNGYLFRNNDLADENRSNIKVGPYISFDAFKGEALRFTLGTGFTYNFHKAYIYFTNAYGNEERDFIGYSLSPLVSGYFQFLNIFPICDFIAGADLTLNLSRTLNATSSAVYVQDWPSNQINESFSPQVSLFTGLQFKY